MTAEICTLCEKPIPKYSNEINRIVIDDNHTVIICMDCMIKIGTQQRAAHAKLFPTKTAKLLLSRNGSNPMASLPNGAASSHSSVFGHGKRPMRRY